MLLISWESNQAWQDWVRWNAKGKYVSDTFIFGGRICFGGKHSKLGNW